MATSTLSLLPFPRPTPLSPLRPPPPNAGANSRRRPFKPARLEVRSLSENGDGREPATSSSSSSSTATVDAPPDRDEGEEGADGELEKAQQQQEADWKTDEEFKKFMGNPSVEAAIKLEKKRADRKLRELDMEAADGNPITGFLKSIARDRLAREKERLEKVEEAFKALDLNKVSYFFSPPSLVGGVFMAFLLSSVVEELLWV